MESEAVGAVHAAAEFSFWALFLRADWVVKAVMASLVIASIWSWGVVLDKQFWFGSRRARARDFEQWFWAGRSLDELAATLGDKERWPMGQVFAAAHREWQEARARGGRDSSQLLNLTERVDRVMGLIVTRELSNAERGLGVLSSVASSSPFIGLLGTVWGIMNSFRAIAISHDTNLAVVAPGIAEALFATALGLIAAIPATIFYNKFATDLARYTTHLEGYADELSAILSRRAQERSA